MSWEEVLTKLQSNPDDLCEETARVLYKIADNIMQDPFNSKLRSLQKTNSTISNKVLAANGGLECLKLMGFVEGNSNFTLPEDSCLEQVELIRNALCNLKVQSTSNENSASPEDETNKIEIKATSSKSEIEVAESGDVFKDIKRFVLPPLVLKYSNEFLRSVETHFHSALAFGDKETQERAKKLIPLEELEASAKDSLKNLVENAKKAGQPIPKYSTQDFLLLELLNWFKEDFFSWVDCPECDFCLSKTERSHMSTDPNDFIYTNRVEVFKCTNCNGFTKFPRYNDLNILLHTRKGRCGEWALVFTLMCCSLGWDARYVVDELDHVWTEVYSTAQERWIHCDSCENACDTPLMYECGWNKKLTYVIAYSAEEVQDVTWRYSNKHKELIGRRHNCTEDELISALIDLRKERQENLSKERREFLNKRLVFELVELITERKANLNENQGRISGGLEWRRNRGEISSENTYNWKIDDESIICNHFTIRYSASQNVYETVYGDGSKNKLADWTNGVHSYTNIFRKEEKDWKTVYLARREGTDSAKIVWKIILTGDKVLDKIDLHFSHVTYEDGKIDIKLSIDDTYLHIPQGVFDFKEENVCGAKSLLISATLSGGKGNVAWQHAQLFRQPLDSKEFPFILKLSFK